MILTVILSNEHTRKPFEGVAALYRALQGGASGGEDNPIFYVSNSAWNLYTPLLEFLNVQKIPLGPLLLRDFGDHVLFAKEPMSHKKRNIKMILDSFPHLSFVLIGDSGESDPEIYRDVVKEYPTRIRTVYIRSIDGRPARLAAIDKLIEEVRHTGSQLVLTPDSEFAAAHAAAEGSDIDRPTCRRSFGEKEGSDCADTTSAKSVIVIGFRGAERMLPFQPLTFVGEERSESMPLF